MLFWSCIAKTNRQKLLILLFFFLLTLAIEMLFVIMWSRIYAFNDIVAQIAIIWLIRTITIIPIRVYTVKQTKSPSRSRGKGRGGLIFVFSQDGAIVSISTGQSNRTFHFTSNFIAKVWATERKIKNYNFINIFSKFSKNTLERSNYLGKVLEFIFVISNWSSMIRVTWGHLRIGPEWRFNF